MDFSQYVVLGFILAGVTELINRMRASDWWVVLTIVTCAVVGAIFGAFEIANVPNIETGVLIGFGASGAIKVVGSLGNKSVPAPSDAVAVKRVK
jgi:hydrogenase/urease accessory protein HupE